MKDFTAKEDALLRDTLKRCPAFTYEAARLFRQTGDVQHVPAIVDGVIQRFAGHDLRAHLGRTADRLRLIEDLGIDSLTMLEILLLAEEVLLISIEHEELGHVRTVGDLKQFIVRKLRHGIPSSCAAYA